MLWFWYQAPICPLGFLSWDLVVRLTQGWLGLGRLKSIFDTSYISSFSYKHHRKPGEFSLMQPLNAIPLNNMIKIMTPHLKVDRVLNRKINVQKRRKALNTFVLPVTYLKFSEWNFLIPSHSSPHSSPSGISDFRWYWRLLSGVGQIPPLRALRSTPLLSPGSWLQRCPERRGSPGGCTSSPPPLQPCRCRRWALGSVCPRLPQESQTTLPCVHHQRPAPALPRPLLQTGPGPLGHGKAPPHSCTQPPPGMGKQAAPLTISDLFSLQLKHATMFTVTSNFKINESQRITVLQYEIFPSRVKSYLPIKLSQSHPSFSRSWRRSQGDTRLMNAKKWTNT